MNTNMRPLLPLSLLFTLLLACSSSSTSPRDGAAGAGGLDASSLTGGVGGSTDGASGAGGSTDGASGAGGSTDGASGAGGSTDGSTMDGAATDGGAGDVATTDGGAGDGATTCGAAAPNCAPTLGAQIDRMGRAGVNTALTDPFWNDGTRTLDDHHAQQDKYNEASNPATWGTTELAAGKTVTAAIKSALAAYDALDGTSDGTMANDGCGNQLAYGATYKGMAYPDYSLLATVLTDDRIYLNTGSGTCSTYLAVEANELGVTNTDCGGRAPSYNTIDVTFSALVTGHAVCTTMCDVSNGVTVDPDKGAGASDTTFPFLGAPTP